MIAIIGPSISLVGWPKLVKCRSGGCLERSGNRKVTVNQTVMVDRYGNTDPKMPQIENLELGSLNLGMHLQTSSETTYNNCSDKRHRLRRECTRNMSMHSW